MRFGGIGDGIDLPVLLASLGVEAVANSPQEAAAYITAEAKKWDTVLRAANIRID